MTIIKRTSSGTAYQVIDDDGRVYSGSVAVLLKLLNKVSPNAGEFIVLNRLPFPVSPDRFPKSRVWNPETNELEDYKPLDNNLKASSDAYGEKERRDASKAKVDKIVYTDKVVD